MKSSWKTAALTFAAGLSLLIPAAIGLIENGPTILSPLPALTVLPAFLLSSFLHSSAVSSHAWYAAAVIPMLLFFFWIPGLFFGDGKIPSRTYALLGIATVLSIVWFAQGWQHGLNDNGVEYTLTLCGVNIAVVLVLAIGFFKSLKEEPSFTTSLILHWFLFAWLAWYAFPWLGEMI